MICYVMQKGYIVKCLSAESIWDFIQTGINIHFAVVCCVLTATIFAFNSVRYLFFKRRLIGYLEKYNSELFKEISSSKSNFLKFITKAENTSDIEIDLSKFKAQRSRRYASGMLLALLFWLVVLLLIILL